VSANGGIRWNRAWVTVSTVCVGESVGFEEIDDGLWNVYFGPLKLGRFNERHMSIEDEFGRRRRHHVSPKSPDFSVTYVPDRSQYTVPWHSASLHESAEFPTDVREVLAMFAWSSRL
jgi:hypothetical protein